MFGANQLDETVDVVALGLRDTGGTDANQVGLRPFGDVEDSLLHVLQPTEHGGNFAHGGGLQRNGLAEMPHEEHQAERRTAL